jgi:uncharacterized membrane protein (DUF2068 family)
MFELWRGVSAFKLIVFAINALVVVYLAHALHSSARARAEAAAV